MLDIRFIIDSPKVVRQALRNRNSDISIDAVVELALQQRHIQQEIDGLRNRRNVVSQEIGSLKKQKAGTSSLEEAMRQVSAEIKRLEEEQRANDDKLTERLLVIPNIPHESVPVGADETANVEVSVWGQPRVFDFEPLNHWDIAKALNIIDFERAAKIAGARFSIMRGAGAALERALMNFMLEHNVRRGYTEVFPPILINRASMTGTGQLPKF
ncbi:seryl-tRNA synthetase, partial [Candidatus Magnetobacterium bavaricum]